MRYYLYWLWHRLTCATCYAWAPFRIHHVDAGRGLGEGFILYLGIMALFVLFVFCTGTVMGYT